MCIRDRFRLSVALHAGSIIGRPLRISGRWNARTGCSLRPRRHIDGPRRSPHRAAALRRIRICLLLPVDGRHGRTRSGLRRDFPRGDRHRRLIQPSGLPWFTRSRLPHGGLRQVGCGRASAFLPGLPCIAGAVLRLNLRRLRHPVRLIGFDPTPAVRACIQARHKRRAADRCV